MLQTEWDFELVSHIPLLSSINYSDPIRTSFDEFKGSFSIFSLVEMLRKAVHFSRIAIFIYKYKLLYNMNLSIIEKKNED